jgi:hypothetical protein
VGSDEFQNIREALESLEDQFKRSLIHGILKEGMNYYVAS